MNEIQMDEFQQNIEKFTLWVEVWLPVPVQRAFTYAWPFADSVPQPGQRLLVELGAKKRYTAVVVQVVNQAPSYETKPVLERLEDEPSVHPSQLALWHWMADYYLCSVGEVMQAALPAALRPSSTSEVYYTGLDFEEESLSDEEKSGLRRLLEAGVLPAKSLPAKTIQRWVERGWASVEQKMETEPAPRMRTEVQYVHRLNDDRQTAEVFAQLKRAKAQSEALLAYFKAGLEPGASSASWGPWVSTGFLRGYLWKPLVEKGILRQRQVEIGLVSPDLVPPPAPVLNEEQQTALALWKASGDRPFLLFGITGSGKTEVYLHRLREVLAEGKHAVVLLPEVALTEGVLARYRLALGESVHVYHGRVSERKRLDLYRALLQADSPPMVVLAARSGIFLPWNRVGLVVVDEEHDASYKQHEPQPRYHARDVALWLASKFKIPIVLGSATPSLESWHRAASGKMVRGTLSRRHGEAPLPKVELVDLAKAQRQGALDGSFTQEVKEAMLSRLQDRKQVLVLQNRRGFAPILLCSTCGHTEECSRCDVSLTYHKGLNGLKCHLCGQTKPLEPRCTSCGSPEVVLKGLGTEKVEEELTTLFPAAHIGRLDADTARSKTTLHKLLEEAQNGLLDLLVGTQMVAKGWDLPGVDLVVVPQADGILAYPDFRAHERAYQLLSQVAGRAGRRAQQGQVYIQSYRPDHRILQQVSGHRYEEMAQEQLVERRQFFHPPYVRLVHIVLSHRHAEWVRDAARWLAQSLQEQLGGGVLGPDIPSVGRINLMYRQQLYVKMDAGSALQPSKEVVRKTIAQMALHPDFRSVRVAVDVDPY